MPYKVGKKPDIKYWYRKKDEHKIQISLQLPDPDLTGRKYGPLDFKGTFIKSAHLLSREL